MYHVANNFMNGSNVKTKIKTNVATKDVLLK